MKRRNTRARLEEFWEEKGQSQRVTSKHGEARWACHAEKRYQLKWLNTDKYYELI